MRRLRRMSAHQYGFTLIELMVALAVAAIIAMIAMPSFRIFVNANRLNGAAGEMAAALQLARSEATRRNSPVTICASDNGTSCAASADWGRWIIVGRDNVSASNETIRDEFVREGLDVTGPANGIRFRPSGLIDAQAVITVCVPETQPASNQRVMTVMVSGNIRTTRVEGGGVCP